MNEHFHSQKSPSSLPLDIMGIGAIWLAVQGGAGTQLGRTQPGWWAHASLEEEGDAQAVLETTHKKTSEALETVWLASQPLW